MNADTILYTVTYFTAGLIVVLGIFMLSGFIIHAYFPANFRILMGMVMIAYGTYRIIVVRRKQRKEKINEE